MCGNYTNTINQALETKGSPPRVRELPPKWLMIATSPGITPACAGITEDEKMTRFEERDHPRVCGNYISLVMLSATFLGSPPRVREFTPCVKGWACLFGDHPRVCGNYLARLTIATSQAGSPPRVRELPGQGDVVMRQLGITPACAGIT